MKQLNLKTCSENQHLDVGHARQTISIIFFSNFPKARGLQNTVSLKD